MGFTGRHFPKDLILQTVRWYLRYNLSYYLYRAVDTKGDTVDFLLTKKRDKKAVTHFFKKAIRLNGMPEKVTIDKSGANTAALEGCN